MSSAPAPVPAFDAGKVAADFVAGPDDDRWIELCEEGEIAYQAKLASYVEMYGPAALQGPAKEWFMLAAQVHGGVETGSRVGKRISETRNLLNNEKLTLRTKKVLKALTPPELKEHRYAIAEHAHDLETLKERHLAGVKSIRDIAKRLLEIAEDEDFDLPEVVHPDALIEASTPSTADAAPTAADTAASDAKMTEWAKRLREHGLVMNVKQPWLHAILHCGKTVENRRAPFPHLAPDGTAVEHRWVLLAASANEGSVKQWDEELQKLRAAIDADPAMDAAQREMAVASLPHHRGAYPRGAIVGLARVTTNLDTKPVNRSHPGHPLRLSPWMRDDPPRISHGWVIDKTIELERPVPYKGKQSSYLYLRNLPSPLQGTVITGVLEQLRDEEW